MGFFGTKKKGTDSLKTLSEKEIQNRLYGHIRNSDRMVQEELPALSKPRQESSSISKSSDHSAKTLTPSGHTPSKVYSPDLFKPQNFQREPLPAVQRSENESVSSKAQEPTAKSSLGAKLFDEGRVKPAISSKSKTQEAGAAVVHFFKQAGFKIAQVLLLLVAAVVKTITSIDFRKPSVRRFFYAVATVALLAFIFMGIHFLNKNRETAMKGPHKGPAVHVKKSKANHPAQPLQAALSKTADENTQTQNEAAHAGEKEPGDVESSTAEVKGPSKADVKKMKAVVPVPVKAETKASAEPVKKVSEGPASVIQVATFAAQEDASSLVGKFKAAGFSSFYKSVSRSAGRVYYCVFIGKFSSRADADNKLAEFKKQDVAKPFQDAFVRSL